MSNDPTLGGSCSATIQSTFKTVTATMPMDCTNIK